MIDGDRDSAKAQLIQKLQTQDINGLGEYQPAGDVNRSVIAVKSPEFLEAFQMMETVQRI